LLLLYPAQFRDGEHTDGLDVHPQRRGNPHPSARRVNAEVDVFDVLLDHLDGDFTKLNLHGDQYSGCSMMRKMRSTSASYCKTPYNAALITCSRAWTLRHPRNGSGSK
jgi:hypothetical protein